MNWGRYNAHRPDLAHPVFINRVSLEYSLHRWFPCCPWLCGHSRGAVELWRYRLCDMQGLT